MAITISLLSFSSLGDIYGYRKIYLSGVLLFSITSGICACADSFWTLTTARILQGFGAAAITGVNTALLRIIYPKRFLGRGMGINALVIAVSTAAGPTIASIILSLGSWHWLFAINIPVGIATLIIGLIYLPDNPVKVTGRHFDKFSHLWSTYILIRGYYPQRKHNIDHSRGICVVNNWLFLCTSPITPTISFITSRPDAYPYFLHVYRHIHLFLHRANASHALPPLFPPGDFET